MNYELAKKLKDAGFPQINLEEQCKDCSIFEWFDDDEILWNTRENYPSGDDWVYLPTLSELIEACGEHFYNLNKEIKGKWCATTNNKKYAPLGGFGSTPEEAVANLWLTIKSCDTTT